MAEKVLRDTRRSQNLRTTANTRLLNEGLRGIEFPAWLRLSAERAYEALLPWGKTIEDALHFYLAHLEKTKTSAPLQKAIDELIKVRREGGRSDVYCYDLKLRLGRFSGDFSDKTTADISTADIDSWLVGSASLLELAIHIGATFGRCSLFASPAATVRKILSLAHS